MTFEIILSLFFPYPMSKKTVVNQCIRTAHKVCILDFSYVCILVLEVCIFILFLFCVASEGCSRDIVTTTAASAFTVDFANSLDKAIVSAGGHAHTWLQPSTLRKLLVYFCDLGWISHKIKAWQAVPVAADCLTFISTRDKSKDGQCL